MKTKIALSVAVAFLASSGVAHSATIAWDQLTSNASGTISTGADTLDVTYAGEMSGFSTSNPGWGPAASYIGDGSVIANAPPAGGIYLLGGGGASAGVDSITFSKAVVNPVFAIWSLGQPGTPASFVFDATPTFVAGGPSGEYGGQSIVVSGDTVSGSEANGTVQFLGTFKSISWTNPQFESYYAFTVGIAGVASAVPEPASTALLLAGGGLLVALRRRRRAVD